MLNGKPVLVVEEEFLIALDIQRMLEALGAGQILFARSIQEAQAMEMHWADVHLAIVEIALEPQAALLLIDRLIKSGIQVVICSADAALRRGVTAFPHAPVIIKPMAETDLVAAINKLGEAAA
jgi:DNA-binding NtrC family response regulator